MSKKATEIFDQEEIWDFKDEVRDTGKNIKDKLSSAGDAESAIIEDRLGICFGCDHCEWCITEFDRVVASCEYFECRLSGKDRMKKCSRFKRRGEMSLNDMAGMAWLIDIPKDGAGFINK